MTNFLPGAAGADKKSLIASGRSAAKDGQMDGAFQFRPSGFALARKAWESAIKALSLMWPLFLSAMFLMIVMSLMSFGVGITAPMTSGHPRPSLAFGYTLVAICLKAAAGAPLAVAVHRMILLQEVTPGVISWNRTYIRDFFCWGISVQLVFFFTALPSSVLIPPGIKPPNPSIVPALLLEMSLLLSALVLSIYAAMIFPDVAIGRPAANWGARIKTSFQRMRGNFWLFVRAAIITFLPVLLIYGVFSLSFVKQLHPLGHKVGSLSLPLLAFSATAGFITTLGVVLAAAIASWLYSWTSRRA